MFLDVCKSSSQHFVPTMPSCFVLYPGSGKTAMLQVLGLSLSRHSRHRAHVLHVSCKSLAGASFETASHVVSDIIQQALQCCPGLVLLDDLDLLCQVQGDGPEQVRLQPPG